MPDELTSNNKSLNQTTNNFGDQVHGDKFSGDKVAGDKITGDVVVTGYVAGDVIVNVPAAPEITPPPPPPRKPPNVPLLVGREKELAQFQKQLAKSGLAIITGMAGIGKTTLAASLIKRLAKQNTVFWHAFHEEEGIEILVWRLAGFMAWHGQNEMWRMLQTAKVTDGKLPPPDMLFDYLIQQLQGQPYLLCLDDFQFAQEDPLLSQLVERLDPLIRSKQIQIIITSREIPDFVRRSSVQGLQGLDIKAVSHLLEVNDVILEPSLVEQLHNNTGGNAQLLTLSIDLLLGTQNPEKLIQNLGETEDVEDFLMDEIEDQLSRNERLVMKAVSVLQGYPGSRVVIEAIIDGRSVRRILRDLSDRYLLTVSSGEEGKLFGQHAIVREFFYEGLSNRESRQMHIRAAEYYRDEEVELLLAARHYFEAKDFSKAAETATLDVQMLINHGQARALNQLLKQIEFFQLDLNQWIAVQIAIGQVYAYFGENLDAHSHYKTALQCIEELPESLDSMKVYIKVCRSMGELFSQQDPHKALQWFEKGFSIVKEVPTQEEEVALNIGTGTVYMYLGRFEEAQKYLQNGLNGLDGKKKQIQMTALENLGVVYVELYGNLDQAVEYTEQALAISDQLNDHFKKAEIMSTLGTLKFQANNWSEGMVDFKNAFALAQSIGNKKILATTVLNLGNAYFCIGDYESALSNFTEGLNLALSTNQQIWASQAYLDISSIFIQKKTWEDAKAYLNKGEQLSTELQATFLFSRIERIHAEIELGLGNIENAFIFANKSLEIAQESSNPIDIGLSLNVCGNLYLATGAHAEAEEALQESIANLMDYDLLATARSKVDLGTALTLQGNIEQGAAIRNEAGLIFKDLGALGDLKQFKRGN